MNRCREKLINAVLYLALNTTNCGLTKMMKLLNFFEFEHFNQTGIPPIGLTYYAYPNGPLPFDFWIEVNRGQLTKDFEEVLDLKKISYQNNVTGYRFEPHQGVSPNLDLFSPREKRILEDLVKEYKFTSAFDMSEISHKDKMPWSKTIEKKGPKAEIDYLDALPENSSIDRKMVREKLNEYFATAVLFNLEPTIPEW